MKYPPKHHQDSDKNHMIEDNGDKKYNKMLLKKGLYLSVFYIFKEDGFDELSHLKEKILGFQEQRKKKREQRKEALRATKNISLM